MCFRSILSSRRRLVALLLVSDCISRSSGHTTDAPATTVPAFEGFSQAHPADVAIGKVAAPLDATTSTTTPLLTDLILLHAAENRSTTATTTALPEEAHFDETTPRRTTTTMTPEDERDNTMPEGGGGSRGISVPGDVPSGGSGVADDASRCESAETPVGSNCTGCPPRFEGKLCASTTWYEDHTMGACGCGDKQMVDHDWWTLTAHTAAMNTVNMHVEDPSRGFCLDGCGRCFELCATGGSVNTIDLHAEQGRCEVFKITNRCADGWVEGEPNWCSQRLSYQECAEDPEKCKNIHSTNMFGYAAHFDLMDAHRQVQLGLQWVNAEVTFEEVPCSRWSGPPDAPCPGCSSGAPASSAYSL